MANRRSHTTWIAIVALLAPAIVVLAPSATGAAAFDFGSDIAIGSAYSNTVRTNVLNIMANSHMSIHFVDAKDGSGKAGWYTTSYPMSGAYAAGDGAVERAVRDGHAKGYHVAVRFATFYDANAAAKWPYARVGGTNFVDPACPEIRSHMLGMLKDLATRTGVDEINLDYVRYSASLPSDTVLPCTGGTAGQVTVKRADVITAFVRDANATIKAARPSVKLSLSVFPQAMEGSLAAYGQDGARLNPYTDVFMPMIYPMNFPSMTAWDVTYRYTKSGVTNFGSAKVRPWIQGEADYAGKVAPVCNQIKAVAAAGGSGALPWWFHTMGFDMTMWTEIGKCVPTSTTTTPPPTTTDPFAATFSTAPSKLGWVQVNVTANRALAAVSVNDDGVALGGLTHLGGASWGGAYSIAAGSIVKFTAKSTDGAYVTSAPITWTILSDSAPFAASFSVSPSKLGWVQVNVTGNRAIAGVSVNDDGVALGALTYLGGSSWGRAYSIADGSIVKFTARSSDGAYATSSPITWKNLADTFTATFTPKAGNEWWIETKVAGSKPIASVVAVLDTGARIALPLTSWGAYAKSAYVPAGSVVRFVATSASGESVTSAPFVWPYATPFTATTPLGATFAKHASGRWWIEMDVTAAKPIVSVAASINGGAPFGLEKTSWGTWAKKIKVPYGASIRFTARAADGTSTTSATYPWP